MKKHVTNQQINALRAGRLPLADVSRVSEHIQACEDCATRVFKDSGASESIDEIRTGFDHVDDSMLHVTPDELHDYTDQQLPVSRARAVEEHITICDLCAEDLADLRALRPAASRRLWWTGIAASIAIVLVVAGWPFAKRTDQIEQSDKTAGAGGRPAAATTGSPAPVESRPAPEYAHPEWASAVTAARATGRLEVGGIVARLRPPAVTVRSDSEIQRSLRVTEPVGEVLLTDRPTFRWQGARSRKYVVRVYSGEDLIVESEPTGNNAWQPPHGLEENRIYSWQVESVTSEGVVEFAPRAPDPPALFAVLARPERQLIQEARERHPDDHLLLAVLYARAGAITAAENALRRYVETERPPNAESLVKSLRR
jgi:anti-sigma factor RsiW